MTVFRIYVDGRDKPVEVEAEEGNVADFLAVRSLKKHLIETVRIDGEVREVFVPVSRIVMIAGPATTEGQTVNRPLRRRNTSAMAA